LNHFHRNAEKENVVESHSSSAESLQECAGRAFGTSIGNLFCGFFGLAWIVMGLEAAGKATLPILLPLCCFLAMIVAASIYVMRRTHGSLDRSEEHRAMGKRINRRFGVVNLIQWSLIFAAVYGLPHLGHGNWIVPAIILIVGVHFFPLARLFKAPRHYVTGSVMVTWAIVYPILFSAGKGDAIGAVGTGAILWTSAVFMGWQAFQLLRRMRIASTSGHAIPGGAHA
jgi:hypothetical protein